MVKVRSSSFRRVYVLWNWVSLLLVFVTYLAIPSLRRAVPVALWMEYGLLQLFLLSRSKTLSWGDCGKALVVGSCIVAPLAAAISRLVLNIAGLNAGDDAAMMWVASTVEETVKILPILLLLIMARRRTREMSVVDFGLIGFASGAGFQLVEDGCRHLINAQSNQLWLGSGPPPGTIQYQFGELFPGGASFAEAHFPGHFLTAGLIGIAIGLAYRLKPRVGWWVLALPVIAWGMCVVDHASFNAASLNAMSKIPSWLRDLHRTWGAGNEVLSLFLLGLLFGQILDYGLVARAQKLSAVRAVFTPMLEIIVMLGLLRSTPLQWTEGSQIIVGIRRKSYAAQRSLYPARERLLVRRSLQQLIGVVGAAAVMIALISIVSIAVTVPMQHVDASSVHFLLRILDSIGTWWDSMSWWQQILFVIALAAFATLLAASASLGISIAFGLSGIFGSASGMAAFLRDPVGVFGRLTPLQLVGALVRMIVAKYLPSVVGGYITSKAEEFLSRSLQGAIQKGTQEARKLMSSPAAMSERMTRIQQLAEENAARRLKELQAQSSKSHLYDRHGSQTEIEQQWDRAKTGLTPDNVQNNPVNASRFLNNRDQLATVQRAQQILERGGNPSVPFSMNRSIGEGIVKDGIDWIRTDLAQAVFSRSGDLITIFPKIGP